MNGRMKTKISYLTLFSFLLLAVLETAAIVYGLFFYWWWFDIPMHFLGGFFAGGFSLSVLLVFSKKFQSVRDIFLATFFGAMLISAVWELFEYFTDLTFVVYGTYAFDTVKDFLMDGLGALVAYAVAVLMMRENVS